METRVYIFAGFLDSGKTSFINDTLMNPDFYSDEDTLLISFESGEISYDEIYLKKSNTSLVTLDHENFTTYDLKHLELEYHPTQIMIEANGMMDLNIFVKEIIPENWKVVQVLTTFDASTFSMYLNNMRSLVYGQVVFSDLVIFNRYNQNIKKSMLRNNIKAINSNTQIIYEFPNGTIDTMNPEIELPYDIQEDHLEIKDHDFGIFCMDAMDHPDKYTDKIIKIKGKFIGLDKVIENGFVLGRQAMVCCEEDTSLIGLVCISKLAKKLIPDEWIIVEGKVSAIFDHEYQIKIPILNVEHLEVVPPLKNQYVTFD
ncbi:MAG: GTP-binding protein [Thomasclavelia sp.]|uniref:TIGR03943 family putative permease subunit n=1 Tax=Thomasclavelia sp. TaxID=3025757 RepID=UPI0039A32B6E